MQTLSQVLLLPLPVDVVDLGVVEVEKGFCERGALDSGLKDADVIVLSDLPPGLLAALPA